MLFHQNGPKSQTKVTQVPVQELKWSDPHSTFVHFTHGPSPETCRTSKPPNPSERLELLLGFSGAPQLLLHLRRFPARLAGQPTRGDPLCWCGRGSDPAKWGGWGGVGWGGWAQLLSYNPCKTLVPPSGPPPLVESYLRAAPNHPRGVGLVG